MEDRSASTVSLPPPVGPARKWLWFLIVLAAVLALIAVSAWECRMVATRTPCKPQPPTLGARAGDISITDCPQASTHSYRCEPLIQKMRGFFGRGGS